MISEATSYWLLMLSNYGWIWIIPIIEYLLPLREQPQIRKGMINDVIHTYHPLRLWTFLNASFIAWLVSYAQATQGQLLPLQGSMSNMHWGWSAFIVVFLGHISFYVAHYLSHKIPFMWQFHRVHHSSHVLDSLSTTRFHIIDKTFFVMPFLLAVTYLTPDPAIIFLYISFRDFWGRYGHGNIRDPHWFGYILSNPKFHRWHHSNHPEAIDKNFSAELNFLDYLFGTAYYPKDRLPDNFGEESYSNNIVVQHIQPFIDLAKIRQRDGWMALLRKPNSSAKKNLDEVVE